MSVEEFDELWADGASGAWELVELTVGDYVIRHRSTGRVKIIEDDDLFRTVIENMLAARVPVVSPTTE